MAISRLGKCPLLLLTSGAAIAMDIISKQRCANVIIPRLLVRRVSCLMSLFVIPVYSLCGVIDRGVTKKWAVGSPG